MVIAGPNGAGKSTLLNALRGISGHQHVIYVGPHRAMRRQQVQQRHLYTSPFSFETILTSNHVPNYEGVRLFDGARDPWSSDESANLLKHALCQIEVDRQQAIALRYDRDGELTRGTLADPWKPLRTLTQNLLPHLRFHRIDAANRDAVRCLWQVHSSETIVDLDDLSSGEKSIIQMFYPLIERDTKALLDEMTHGTPTETKPALCVLIDEPELHLHPNLQVKVLDYLRLLTSGESTQVIVATHSPTMVENTSFEELFLLRPPELIPTDENQLVQVATDEERLLFIREVFGSTSNLTAMQPVVIVEGVHERDATRVTADRKLYRRFHDGFDRTSMIAGGGKSECRSLLNALNNVLPQYSTGLRAVALLDRDGETREEVGVRLLPVAMIENFLLDPETIWEAIQSVVERTPLDSVEAVAAALDQILDELEPEEAERRALRLLGPLHYWPRRPVADIPTDADAFAAQLRERYSADAVRTVIEAAQRGVTDTRARARRREEFHGKAVVEEFFKRFLRQSGLPKNVFLFECARHAKRRRAVTAFFDEFFAKEVPDTGPGARAV
jgi:energy-coupling factor transporter ATP-binding protein EcfA2